MSHGFKILFQLSGSIACYKACHVISRLVQAGHEVQTVATKSALEFVGAATLEGLTGKPVVSEVFEPGRYMDHINLAKWADLVVLCPASANTINKMAAGIGDDLVSTLFLAHDFKKPYLVAPAMNTKMYQHPATAASIAKLRGWGVEILETASGVLACGDVGEGRLLEPDLILSEITQRLSSHKEPAITQAPRTLHPLKVLITSGGTREAIDGVRAITNTSTGSTGAEIADVLAETGHEVTFLHAKDSVLPKVRTQLKLASFVTFADLDAALRKLLGETRFDAIIHAAAVSDFAVNAILENGQPIPREQKIDSGAVVSIELKNNPKLLPQLRSYSRNPRIVVVGFKLTNGASSEERKSAVSKIAPSADLVVHNDLQEITPNKHEATLYENLLMFQLSESSQTFSIHF